MFLIFCTGVAFGQCPANIGFDFGDFTNWVGATGTASKTDGSLSFDQIGISPAVHTIFYAKDHQVDPYGNFPIVSPNGSSCCVRLGNTSTGTNKAQQLTYTFTVPSNDPDYSLIYYYAVVFQNPNHLAYQQPRFTAKVFDVTDNQYISCGDFDFVASSGLPGFQQSGTVFYKDWSAVTINLLGFSGKTLRLEFATNNCTLGGHFGYAYLDVNQNCTSPVSGNVYCSPVLNNTVVNLTAPAGFQSYYWYSGTDFSNVIGTANTLSITPAPAIGTRYAVRIVPYPGIGCEDTLYTTIKATEPLILKVKDTITQCSAPSVNLTDSTVTAGSNYNFTYTYYTDAACTNNLIGPQAVTQSGTYYIQATSPGGCSVVKPVVIFVGNSFLNIKSPAAVCQPSLVNLTDTSVTSGSTSGAILSYWKDANATIALTNPSAVDSSGIYYIKAITNLGCVTIKPVTVTVNKAPKFVLNVLPPGCTSIDITSPIVTAGSDAGLAYTYWLDSALTKPLLNPKAITTSGTYYVSATTAAGCAYTKQLMVSVFLPPAPLVITKPAAVTYPTVVNLKTTFTPQTDILYTYWRDTTSAKQLTTGLADRTGTYYIKGTNTNGCSTYYPVSVTVNPPPPIDFGVNVFTPNGDGLNDGFKFKVPFYVIMKSLKIFNTYGQLLFQTSDPEKFWDGKSASKYVPVGTYYWIFEGRDNYNLVDIKQAGSISIVK